MMSGSETCIELKHQSSSPTINHVTDNQPLSNYMTNISKTNPAIVIIHRCTHKK